MKQAFGRRRRSRRVRLRILDQRLRRVLRRWERRGKEVTPDVVEAVIHGTFPRSSRRTLERLTNDVLGQLPALMATVRGEMEQVALKQRRVEWRQRSVNAKRRRATCSQSHSVQKMTARRWPVGMLRSFSPRASRLIRSTGLFHRTAFLREAVHCKRMVA